MEKISNCLSNVCNNHYCSYDNKEVTAQMLYAAVLTLGLLPSVALFSTTAFYSILLNAVALRRKIRQSVSTTAFGTIPNFQQISDWT